MSFEFVLYIQTKASSINLSVGENIETCTTKEEIQEAHTDDTDVDLESEKLEMENNHPRNVVFQDCDKEQNDKVKDPTSDVKTPSTNTRAGCLIKYNVSTTPYLQSVKK